METPLGAPPAVPSHVVRLSLRAESEARDLVAYPETRFTWESDDILWVEAPWMRTRITGCPAETRATRTTSEALVAELAQWPHLRRLPYWFHVPRSDTAGDARVTPSSTETAAHPTPPCERDVASIVSRARDLGFEGWVWPLHAVVERARCARAPESCDALSVYGLLRREVLLHDTRSNSLGRDVHAFFTREDSGVASHGGPRHELLLRLVHTSLRVTSLAPRILAPACRLPGELGALVRAFVEGEQGHDVFARRSLRLLTAEASVCSLPPPHPALELVLEVLALCAKGSPLALAVALFAFERLSFDVPTWSPWSALGACDARHAREGVGKHAEINEREQHSDVGLALADALRRVTLGDALVAARLTELCVWLRARVLEDLYAPCVDGPRDP